MPRVFAMTPRPTPKPLAEGELAGRPFSEARDIAGNRMAESLARLITDFASDQEDSDGAAVFEEAKSALAAWQHPKPLAGSGTEEKGIRVELEAHVILGICAIRYQAAVRQLAQIVDGKTLWEHAPSKSQQALDAFLELNEAGKMLSEALKQSAEITIAMQEEK